MLALACIRGRLWTMDAKLMCDGAWRWPWAALALCGVGLMACSPTYNWRDVPLDGAAFKAQLPCKPERAERQVPLTAAGVRLQLLSCEAGGLTYALAWARPEPGEPPEPLPVLLDRWQLAGWASLRQTVAEGAPAPAGWSAWPLTVAQVQSLRAWQGSGQNHTGQVLQVRQVYLAHAGVVYQAAVYGQRLPAEAVTPFFDALAVPTARP